jgi:dynamin-binding protein
MTREDVKVIFSNIAELAMFANMFSDRLEDALGSIIGEGQREDHVGELFLQIVCLIFASHKLTLNWLSFALRSLC